VWKLYLCILGKVSDGSGGCVEPSRGESPGEFIGLVSVSFGGKFWWKISGDEFLDCGLGRGETVG
jgi:hypothetical protein